MKKELPDTITLQSFFMRIPCKTKIKKQSVRCKQRVSWLAGPLSNFSRAFIVISTALISSETEKKACCIVQHKENGMHVAFCHSLHSFFSAYGLKQ
jgi:hypothetical protein